MIREALLQLGLAVFVAVSWQHSHARPVSPLLSRDRDLVCDAGYARDRALLMVAATLRASVRTGAILQLAYN
jgi:hypothetical protein